MAETRDLVVVGGNTIKKRRGFDVYAENPSRRPVVSLRSKVIPLEANSNTLVVIDEGSGEVFGHGSLGLIKRERVDRARFISGNDVVRFVTVYDVKKPHRKLKEQAA